MTLEELDKLREELVYLGMSAGEAAAFRLVERGRLTGIPYATVAAGDAAVVAWHRVRGLSLSSRSPLTVNRAEEMPEMHEIFQASFTSIAEIIAVGREIDNLGQWPTILESKLDEWRPSNCPPPDMHGPWPEIAVARNEFAGPYYTGFRPRPTVDILLPACAEPWMLPAVIRAEPHNYLPDAAMQCAVFRSWFRRFGAEVVYTNGCVYEFLVSRPPRERETALELAREQDIFCPDRLTQCGPDNERFSGPGTTLEELAATLMESTVWYFWWD